MLKFVKSFVDNLFITFISPYICGVNNSKRYVKANEIKRNANRQH